MASSPPTWKAYVLIFSFLSVVIFEARFVAPVLTAILGIDTPFDNRSFERDVWIDAGLSSDPDNPRGLMAADLGMRLMVNRPTYQETLMLLGEPDSLTQGSFIRYYVGMWSGFRMDYDSFDIFFDSTQRVSTIAIIQH